MKKSRDTKFVWRPHRGWRYGVSMFGRNVRGESGGRVICTFHPSWGDPMGHLSFFHQFLHDWVIGTFHPHRFLRTYSVVSTHLLSSAHSNFLSHDLVRRSLFMQLSVPVNSAMCKDKKIKCQSYSWMHLLSDWTLEKLDYSSLYREKKNIGIFRAHVAIWIWSRFNQVSQNEF